MAPLYLLDTNTISAVMADHPKVKARLWLQPGTPDPIILEWAANNGRVLLTGDLNTMVGFAWGRVQAGLPMVGVLALLENVGVGRVIDDIRLVALCYAADEIKEQVLYIPF